MAIKEKGDFILFYFIFRGSEQQFTFGGQEKKKKRKAFLKFFPKSLLTSRVKVSGFSLCVSCQFYIMW